MTKTEKAAQMQLDFQKAVIFANNINYDEFTKVLKKMLGLRTITENYADEHWTQMRHDLATWIVNLDTDAQTKFFEAAIEKYGF